MTLKELILKAFEKEGLVCTALEYSVDGGGESCWDFTFQKDGKDWSGGWVDMDWLELGPGSELQISLEDEDYNHMKVKVTLGNWEGESHDAKVRRLIDNLTVRHNQLLQWLPSSYTEEEIQLLEAADVMLEAVAGRLEDRGGGRYKD